jgi:CRISPR-associated protein Csd1
VSEQAAAEYGAALNSILDGPKRERHRVLLGDSTLAFWTDRPSLVEDVFAQFADRGSDVAPRKGETQDATVLRQMTVFLDALRQGLEEKGDLAEETKRTRFHLLGLSPNQGRIAVRFFLQGTVEELVGNLRRHHHDIGIVRQFDDSTTRPDPEFPATWMLLRQSGRESKDIPPNLSAPLLRAVVAGDHYPESLLGVVIRRIRADREINYLRACIIKGCLVRNHGEEIAMSLDIKLEDPAYRLGRLFAVLERVQQVASLRQTGKFLDHGIRDNYFTTACATPAAAFPRLERLSTHHRRQLSGGQKDHYDRLIADIKNGLAARPLPNVLTLPDQGMFTLGYYHQWVDLRSKKEYQASNNTEE